MTAAATVSGGTLATGDNAFSAASLAVNGTYNASGQSTATSTTTVTGAVTGTGTVTSGGGRL